MGSGPGQRRGRPHPHAVPEQRRGGAHPFHRRGAAVERMRALRTDGRSRAGVFIPTGNVLGTVVAPPRPLMGRAVFLVATVLARPDNATTARTLLAQFGGGTPDVGATFLRLEPHAVTYVYSNPGPGFFGSIGDWPNTPPPADSTNIFAFQYTPDRAPARVGDGARRQRPGSGVEAHFEPRDHRPVEDRAHGSVRPGPWRRP